MATFRLDRSTDTAGTSERIVDDHGVIALVKARGKTVGAGNLLAASPDLLQAGKHLTVKLAEAYRIANVDWRGCQAIADFLKAAAKAEGKQ